MTEQTYTVKEVAALMQVHTLTVIRWIGKGLVKGHKVGGKKSHWRVSQSELDRLTGTVAHGLEVQ